jgi:ComF family protein
MPSASRSATPLEGRRHASLIKERAWNDVFLSMASVRTFADGLLAVLLAPTCVACEQSLSESTRGPVCGKCWNAIDRFTPPLCDRCGDPLPSWRVISVAASLCPRCRRRPAPVTRGRAIGPYDGSLRAILHALKYGGCRSLAGQLGTRMRVCAADVLDGASIAVPVPLHRSRQRQRGFNQAAELARHLGLPVVPALRRIRATPSQTDLPAARRHANVRDAFALRHGIDVAGLCIVLVDDVSTTGATLESCARMLAGAGAREVRTITAARVVSRPTGSRPA